MTNPVLQNTSFS